MVSCKQVERLIIKHTNRSRRKRGLHSLRTNRGLMGVAKGHSHKMAKKGHIWHGKGVRVAQHAFTTKTFWDFLSSLFMGGQSGENVGLMPLGRVRGLKGVIRTGKDVALAQHNAWMRSAGHKNNILNSNFTHIGVGVCKRGNRFYCTQLFYG